MTTCQNMLIISILRSLTHTLYSFWLRKVENIRRNKFEDCLQEGIFTVNDLGIIIYKNKAMDSFILDAVGLNLNILGKSVEFVLSKWPQWFSSCKSMQIDEFEINTLILEKERCFYVKVYPYFGNNLRKRGVVSIIYDITERKIREAELVATVEENTKQIKKLTGELSIQNKQCYPPALRVHSGRKIGKIIKKDIKDETYFTLQGSTIYDKKEKKKVFLTTDSKEQILNQKFHSEIEQLVALNALKDKLLTVFAHDIRNPMANMVSLIELLESDDENYNAENREIIGAVKEQFNHSYNIVENLIEWLRSQKEGLIYNPLVWDLSEIVLAVVKGYNIDACSKNISINSEITVGMVVFADKSILEIVLRNILSNAIKFTGSSGKITIQAYETKKETIISIEDTGRGIEKERLTTLFSAGNASSTIGTAGEKGIGLGLLISKEFVTQNGGRMWAESTFGRGSTFYFAFPTVFKI